LQLGFVLDQSRCIGCHACTVACKSENHVPVGKFRTWVKYTEQGSFPQVRRSFTVLRCNQCTDAPCVTICPVRALEKRPDGIVDLDQGACIGCKACLQGCPYDAIYLNEDTGTAEKCHFCAHRTERGLAPACAVVCPTEAIVPGDFDDPASRVSRLLAGGELTARKPEAGTGPNVHYVAASEAGLVPIATTGAGGYLWSDTPDGIHREADRARAAAEPDLARTTYDVAHAPVWGWKVSAYLFTKSVAAGALLALLPVAALRPVTPRELALASAIALAFLVLTTVLLVADLKRPGRFLKILLRPNGSSWLVKGTYALMLFGAAAAAWIAAWYLDAFPGDVVEGPLLWGGLGATAAAAALAAGYTAFLFGQAKGRVLWMQRGLFWHLLVQAYLAGLALAILVRPWFGWGDDVLAMLAAQLTAALVVHVGFDALAPLLSPRGRREEYRRAVALWKRGPLARRHRLALGLALAAVALLLPLDPALASWLAPAGAGLALLALLAAEDTFVRAGQALPIS
jgi:Fe-S-cluster-containing dehydrogenase component